MPQPTAHCTCGGTLLITGEMREKQWRIGFRLVCRECGKKWKYTRGFYTTDEDIQDASG